MVESDLSPLPVDSPRSIATSGRAVAALDRSLGPADRPRRAEYRHIVDTPGIPVEVVHAGGPDLPAAEVPVLHSAPKLAGWTGGAASVSPLSVPDLDFAATRKASNPLESSPPTAVAPAVRTVAVAPVPRDEDSILEVLREYETAVGHKDPLAAKAVWPALDDRALARAFNDLQSHSLELQGCGVTVAHANAASATCQGVATYLPKIGRRKPISASHEWTFNLSKTGGDWQIESAAIR